MSDSLLSNPAAFGLLGGVVTLVIQFVWDRVTGAKDSKSIPVELAEIKTKLAAIETTLELIKNNARHAANEYKELKEDFWDHIEKYHSGTTPRRGDSGHHRVQERE